MSEKGDLSKKKSSPRANLTLFGDWFYFLADYLNVTGEEIAERAEFDKSSISRATRDYKDAKTMHPTRSMVERILHVMHEIAREKQMPWWTLLDTRMFHAAGYATEKDMRECREALTILKSQHPL